MAMPIRKTKVFLIAFLLLHGSTGLTDVKPAGFWTLDNANDQMPYGGLTFDQSDQFKLMLYDDNCQLHTVEGEIRKKNNNRWELKSAIDYSNVFIMTKVKDKLQLVDTEGVHLLFSKTTKQALQSGLKKHSCRTQTQKTVQKSNNKANQ